MASLNKVMLIGRLTDNPEPPRTLPNSGSTVVKFRFAVGRSKKNPQTGQWENDPNPLYIDCEVFSRPDSRRQLTDVVSNYLRKGSQAYVEGRLQLDTWEDKNGGGKRSKIKMVVDSLELLDKAGDNPGGGGGNYGGGASYGDEDGGAPPPRQNYGGGGGNRGGYGGGGGGGAPNGRSSAPPPRNTYSAPPSDDDGPGGGQDDIPF